MQRKIMLSILGIMIMVCVIFLGYEIRYSEKQEVNNMMAIYLEEEKGTGKYQKTNLYKWPSNSEYALNMHKTYCENGSILRYNLETNKINVKVKGTDKCYIYFDKASYGTEEHPYLIQTIEDLVRLSNKVNGGTTYAGEYFLLTNDLDFNNPSDYEDAERTDFKDINGINGNEPLIKELTTGSGFIPIGNSETNSFQGTFDGGNKRIDNLYINNEIEGTNLRLGLFGEIANATIMNITLKGQITSKVRAVMGSISGGASGTNTLSNITNYITITSESNEYDVGGIIGGNYGKTTIKNCQNYGELNGANNTGGIVGFINNNLTIENCINYGNVTNNLGENAAGILGWDSSQDNITIIINSHNEGKITLNDSDGSIVNNTTAGGLVGKLKGNIKILDSYNIGEILNVSKNAKYPNGGGIIALVDFNNQGEVNIENTHNYGKVTSETRVGGIIGANDNRIKSIVNKCSNNNQITATNSSGAQIGGIIGINQNSNLFVLNTFNIGSIFAENGNMPAGLVGYNYNNAYCTILNSYNTGTVTNENSHAYGIFSVSGTFISTIKVNNVYNLGKINAKFAGAIGSFQNNTLGFVENTYYDNSILNSDNLTTFGQPMNINDMKSQLFTDQLNQNIESINLSEIDESLKDYKLSNWTLDSDGYPTLDF